MQFHVSKQNKTKQKQLKSLMSWHYEIMTLKITLKIFVTLKRYGNHTENIYKGNHSYNPGLSH